MILTTWNVNSLKVRHALVKKWLNNYQPDFLLLQEIKGQDESLLAFEDIGYNSYYRLQKTYNGVAILSKVATEIIHQNLPNFNDAQARYLEVKYKNIHIINLYIPNGSPIDTAKYQYKIDWLQALYLHLQTLIKNDVAFIIAGDFNIAPTDLDIYNPKLFIDSALSTKVIRDIYFKIINLGLTDILRLQFPNQSIYTWWDYRHGALQKNHGLRIDHILASPYLADYFVDSSVDCEPRYTEKPSDHTPVSCKLSYKL